MVELSWTLTITRTGSRILSRGTGSLGVTDILYGLVVTLVKLAASQGQAPPGAPVRLGIDLPVRRADEPEP